MGVLSTLARRASPRALVSATARQRSQLCISSARAASRSVVNLLRKPQAHDVCDARGIVRTEELFGAVIAHRRSQGGRDRRP